MAEIGMSYSELSRKLLPPCSRQAVNDMVSRIGKGKGITTVTAKRLTEALGCGITDLVSTEWILHGRITVAEPRATAKTENGDESAPE